MIKGVNYESQILLYRIGFLMYEVSDQKEIFLFDLKCHTLQTFTLDL